MAKTKISEYSVTNSSNTDINSINIDEGCAPSGINNAIREVMVHLKNWQTNASGDGATFANLVVQGTGSFTGAVTMSAGATLSGTNTLSGSNIISGNINSSGTTNTFSGGNILSGTNTLSGSTVMAASLGTSASPSIYFTSDTNTGIFSPTADTVGVATGGSERVRVDSSGNVGIGTTAPAQKLHVYGTASSTNLIVESGTNSYIGIKNTSQTAYVGAVGTALSFENNGSERARITSGGDFIVNSTSTGGSDSGTKFAFNVASGYTYCQSSDGVSLYVNRNVSDGTLVSLRQANTEEGSISVSGNTVSYNSFAGSHWSQLQQGRGYNPEILRGTVMSTIGEMCKWKSVVWNEVIEHPAVPAIEAKEAVLDEEDNVIEPAVEAVEGKDAWTETIPHRESYLGQLPIGATFEEDGFTKTVVDDGNERLPKVKISDVVGDKAVYGVFQTWDEVQDMLVTSLGAFVVRIASGVTVQIGDLLESNGDGCAKVQDDDVIRSKTIAKVTSTTPTATYADGSYTVPAVIYCG